MKSGRSSAPKPLTASQQYQRSKSQSGLIRAGALAGAIFIVVFSLIPDTIVGVAWRSWVWSNSPLGTVLGYAIIGDLTVNTVIWTIIAGGYLYLAYTIRTHGLAIANQRIKALAPKKVYLRYRTPTTQSVTPAQAQTLITTMHGLPRASDGQGPSPFLLRWSTSKGDKPQQGISVLDDPVLVSSIVRTLEGSAQGALAEQSDDPIMKAWKKDMVLLTTTMRLVMSDDVPMTMLVGSESPVLDALLPALATQNGVVATDVSIAIHPMRTSSTQRMKVMMKAEQFKDESQGAERKLLDLKARGPSFAFIVRIFVVAESSEAGQSQIQTIGNSFAATAQRIGPVEQRLVPTSIEGVPFDLPTEPLPDPGLPIFERGSLGLIGIGVSAVATTLLSSVFSFFLLGPGVWGWGGVVLWIASTIWLGLAFRGQDPAKINGYLGMLRGVFAPVNPRSIPIWSEWADRPLSTLSAPEVAALWHAPTAGIGDRVQRVAARWVDPPKNAFIDPNGPKSIVLGYGRTSEGTWAPVGMNYPDFRFLSWMRAPMGRGKSEYIKTIAKQLFLKGAGGMFMDCKGTSLRDDLMPLVPLERERDVVVLELGGTRVTGEELHPSMNLVSPSFGASLGIDHSTQSAQMMNFFGAMDSKFTSMPGIMQFATNGLLALLEGEPNATLLHLIRFYGDEDYRLEIAGKVKNPTIRDFWERRFPAMPQQQLGSLASFERRLDQLLNYPALSAMLIAPGCSIDIRSLMDRRGILLAGISAADGQVASIASTMLLTQMTLAALSRNNIPEEQREDWPVIIDEAQIPLGNNPGMAPVIFSQLRSFRIGTFIIHQNTDQLAAVLSPLAGNAQFLFILGSQEGDAGRYASAFGSLGLNAGDFTQMERFQHIRLKFLGTNLFSARMPPMVTPLDEEPPPTEKVRWRSVRAPQRTEMDRKLDAVIDRMQEMAKIDQQGVIDRLGALCRTDPATFDAYCARTKAHRQTQRAFILDHPGCIQPDMRIEDEAKRRKEQKFRRVAILSALQTGIPRTETAALQLAVLESTKIADAAKKAAEEEAKAAKAASRSGGRGKAPVPSSAESGVSRADLQQQIAHAREQRGAKFDPAAIPDEWKGIE